MPTQGFAPPGSIQGGYGQSPASVHGSEMNYPTNPYYNQASQYQSQMSLAQLGGPPPPMSTLPRRQSGMSAFSYGGAPAASVYSMNPFMSAPPAPNDESNPSDEILVAMLKQFLATQDREHGFPFSSSHELETDSCYSLFS